MRNAYYQPNPSILACQYLISNKYNHSFSPCRLELERFPHARILSGTPSGPRLGLVFRPPFASYPTRKHSERDQTSRLSFPVNTLGANHCTRNHPPISATPFPPDTSMLSTVQSATHPARQHAETVKKNFFFLRPRARVRVREGVRVGRGIARSTCLASNVLIILVLRVIGGGFEDSG